jgi:hypothetical protein
MHASSLYLIYIIPLHLHYVIGIYHEIEGIHVGGISDSWWDRLRSGLRRSSSGVRSVVGGVSCPVGGQMWTLFETLFERDVDPWETSYPPLHVHGSIDGLSIRDIGYV